MNLYNFLQKLIAFVRPWLVDIAWTSPLRDEGSKF